MEDVVDWAGKMNWKIALLRSLFALGGFVWALLTRPRVCTSVCMAFRADGCTDHSILCSCAAGQASVALRAAQAIICFDSEQMELRWLPNVATTGGVYCLPYLCTRPVLTGRSTHCPSFFLTFLTQVSANFSTSACQRVPAQCYGVQ
jgi:hypothetical protein